MSELPKLPAVFLNSGQSTPKPIDLGSQAPKSDRLARKMQCIRMRESLVAAHAVAHATDRPDEERIAATHALAFNMLQHFELIVHALGVAGGSKKI